MAIALATNVTTAHTLDQTRCMPQGKGSDTVNPFVILASMKPKFRTQKMFAVCLENYGEMRESAFVGGRWCYWPGVDSGMVWERVLFGLRGRY